MGRAWCPTRSPVPLVSPEGFAGHRCGVAGGGDGSSSRSHGARVEPLRPAGSAAQCFQIWAGPRPPCQLRAAAALNGSGAAREDSPLPPSWGKNEQQDKRLAVRLVPCLLSPPCASLYAWGSLSRVLTSFTALYKEQVTTPAREGVSTSSTQPLSPSMMEWKFEPRAGSRNPLDD